MYYLTTEPSNDVHTKANNELTSIKIQDIFVSLQINLHETFNFPPSLVFPQ